MKKQLLISIAILIFLFTGTTMVILYGRGYRFWFDRGRPDISGTGLLVARSDPDGAQVFVNDHLTTATNSTINLSPGEYTVRIYKEGYSPWEKKIKIQKEVVSVASALLFSTTPKLENITDIGITAPVVDPSGTEIAFNVASQSARKNGIYVLDLSSRPILTLQGSSTQIVDDTTDTFSKSLLSWSPDGKELLATIFGGIRPVTTYLLDAKSFNQNPKDVTETIADVNIAWEKQKTDKEKSRIFGFKPILKSLISENFRIIAWSSDETKILYIASQSATLSPIILPPLIGANSTPEERSIQKDAIYVYDLKEDKNFRIDIPQPLTWFPDSKHLIFVNNHQISIMEYDGGNKTVIYAGPFIDNYVFPWPDGSKIVILTNLGNSNISPNLYTIGLK